MAARTQDQNLDSLLDTMANVVGILVVLVAVTQLSVGDAVERIREQHGAHADVAVEEVEAARARAEAVDARVGVAEGELEAFAASERRRGLLLEEIRPHVETLEAFEGRFEATPSSVAALEEQVRARAEAAALLSNAVGDAERKLSRLEALVAEVPAERRPKIARLPDPRPPPPSLQEVAFFCRYGHVAGLDLEGMKGMLRRGIRSALGDDRAIVFEDREWLVNLFQKRRFGAGNFYWAFREEQDVSFFADIRWIDESYGESVSDLRGGRSAFAEALARAGRAGHFARFYVWSDSFDVYLEARYVAEAAGWDVSWLAVDRGDEVGIDLLGRSRRPVLLD